MLLLQKALLLPFGPMHGRGSREVKRVSSGFRERLRQKPETREIQRSPSKTSGLQRLLVVLEGEPFEETLTQSGDLPSS